MSRPATYGWRFLAVATEPIGSRLVELPEHEQAALDRDPRSGFVVYAPTGSLAKGQALVTTGGDGKTTACGICHAGTLRGLGTTPAIAGRHGNYIVRQLYFFQDGERSGTFRGSDEKRGAET